MIKIAISADNIIKAHHNAELL